MGYPMTYGRVISRNSLGGDYSHGPRASSNDYENGNIAGDLRRLEADTQDDRHIRAYARQTGATEDQVRALFHAFFSGGPRWKTEDWNDYSVTAEGHPALVASRRSAPDHDGEPRD